MAESEPEDCGYMADESGVKVLVKRHIAKGETCDQAFKRVQESWKAERGKNLKKISEAEAKE